MNVELRHLRCLVALADAGSFTDAAAELRISQAGVSRTIAALEAALGVLLVRRTTRAGRAHHRRHAGLLGHARRVLAGLDLLVQAAQLGLGEIRVGYAWRRWARTPWRCNGAGRSRTPRRSSSWYARTRRRRGSPRRVSDVAVLRVPPDDRRFASAVVGLERRFSAIAADDPWARRRAIGLSELAERTVVIDRRTGSTTLSLWPENAQPSRVMHTGDIDDWLAVDRGGEAIGVTAESTAAQYPRPGIRYRPIPGTTPIPVSAAWWREEAPPGNKRPGRADVRPIPLTRKTSLLGRSSRCAPIFALIKGTLAANRSTREMASLPLINANMGSLRVRGWGRGRHTWVDAGARLQVQGRRFVLEAVPGVEAGVAFAARLHVGRQVRR